jgi:hypothetical protein
MTVMKSLFLPTIRLPCDALRPRHRARYSSCNNSSEGKRPVSGIHGCTFHHSSCSVILIVTLDALLTWLINLLEARSPYIYRLVSHIHSHIRLHIYLRLHWYEPHSWGISSYTNYISNGPELWGSRCRYTCNINVAWTWPSWASAELMSRHTAGRA